LSFGQKAFQKEESRKKARTKASGAVQSSIYTPCTVLFSSDEEGESLRNERKEP
jgi:hypothetical protein